VTAVIRVHVQGQLGPPAVPSWVKSCDVDAMDGYGLAQLTTNRDEALTFDDFTEAMMFWRRQSTVRPIRGDGKPNRPLTAYTIEVESL
jgi:hypothetical protein